MGRSTIPLDDDLLAKLKSETHRTGKSLKEVVNTTVRRGLEERKPAKARGFRISHARDLGAYPGIDYDNIGRSIEYAEGPPHK